MDGICDPTGNIISAKISRAVIACNCITSLVIQDCGLSDKSIEHMVADPTNFNSLSNLDLSYNKIRCVGAACLAKTLLAPNTSVLICVKISNNMIEKNGALAIGDAIRSNYTLKYLDIKFNRLKDEGGAAILNCIRGNISLTSLNLSSNALGNRTALAMKSMIEAQSIQLKCLDMSLNEFSTEEINLIESTLNAKQVHQLHVDFRLNAKQKK